MNQPLEKLEQLEHAIEDTLDEALSRKGAWRTTARVLGWAVLAIYFLFAAALLSLRYWILPKVAEYRADVEQIASKALGQRITIGSIEADWQGLRPELLLGNVTVFDHDGRAALSLPGVEATVAWTSALIGAPRFYSLAFDRPRLEIRRDEAGKFHVAGIELHPAQRGDVGMAQWVLSQREIVIRDASVTWEDGLRGAPLLEFQNLDFVLRNGFLAHRFAFKGKPSPELASALDVRGELRGGDLGDWGAWSGQVYAELEYTDLAVWRRWIDYPLDIRAGKGGVRLWINLDGKSYSEATADVALSQVSVRVAKSTPVLDLEYLRGRLGASQRAAKGFEISGRKVTLKTATDIVVPPADFRVRLQMEEGGASSGGEVEADGIELAPLAKLAEYFPFSPAVRERLAQSDPRGSLHNVKANWIGEADDPQHFDMRGSFRRLAARAQDKIPGVAGLTGRFEASEKGGTLVLGSEKVVIELPGIIAEGATQLDSLAAQINWKLEPNRIDVGFNNLSFANSDVAGTLSGSFTRTEDGSALIDLTGNFSRVDGRTVYRYVPRLPPTVVDYLKASIRGGGSRDVKLRLKGPLARFPFEEPGTGIFQIVAKVDDADFRYAEGWPQASGLSGDLIFEGKGMRIAANKGSTVGVQASSVRAAIPDLYHGDVHVSVEVRAEDQTADFLRFVAQSPVAKFLEGMTEGWSAKGLGRLALQFDIPIRNPEAFKLSGDYQVVDNEIKADPDAPPFSNVNGRIEFSESGIAVRTLTSQLLGGPATLSVATRPDGTIAVNAQGTASAPQILRFYGETFLRQVSGAAAWHGTMTGGRGKPVTLTVQSQLVGIAASLPPPLGKEAAEPMSLRVERVIGARPSRGDSVKVSLGQAVEAQFVRRRESAHYVVERGVISLNQPAVLPDRDGMTVTGSLPYADADRWRALFGGKDPAGSPLSSAFDLKIAALDFAGRRLNDVALRAGTSGNVWIANVSSRELSGEIAWRPEGLGRLIARLKHFTLPDATPGRKDEAPPRDLPALDIIADKLILNGNDFGKLELVAVNKVLDWRIENLVLSAPEGTLKAEGVWQSWRLQPRFNLNITRLDVSDIGKYLERLGYAGTVRGGTARLKGHLSWAGSPQSIDFATLSGDLQLEAHEGQFVRAEPGAARLIGILSAPLALDFRELARRGFAFDRLSCGLAITNGSMTTKDFRMTGPSAQVEMSGRVDLVNETQDLNARVEPSIGESSSLVVAVVVNPVWGLGALLLQKILKNPLGQVLSFEYHVTGNWTDPKVERLKADVRSPPARQEPYLQ